jgi:hypothetical protein
METVQGLAAVVGFSSETLRLSLKSFNPAGTMGPTQSSIVQRIKEAGT